jgi:hypothetical protein
MNDLILGAGASPANIYETERELPARAPAVQE